MWKRMKKIALMTGVFVISLGIYSTNVYALDCDDKYVMTEEKAGSEKEEDYSGTIGIGATPPPQQDAHENDPESADNQVVETACEEGEDCGPEPVPEPEPPMDLSDPTDGFDEFEDEMWEACREELFNGLVDNSIDGYKADCIAYGATDCDEYAQSMAEDEASDTLTDDYIKENCYNEKYKEEVPDLMSVLGTALNNDTSNCTATVSYMDMEWRIDFEGYRVQAAIDDATAAFVLWDGEVSYPGSSEHEPFYVDSEMYMHTAFYVGSNTSGIESKVYPPMGYIDKEIADENELFDFYIMVVDNPESCFAEKYHLIPSNLLVSPSWSEPLLEKVPFGAAQIKYSTERSKNRGTNYIKRLRYSDITYKRYFEIQGRWGFTLFKDGNIFTDGCTITATEGSWDSPISGANTNQKYGLAIGDSVTTRIRSDSYGNTKTTTTFPYMFTRTWDSGAGFSYTGASYYYHGSPYFGGADKLMKSFEDVVEKQDFILANPETFGDTTRGKIIIGRHSMGHGTDQVAVMENIYFSLGQPEFLTDIDGNPVQLEYGQWRWYQHQNGVLNQTFYVEPNIIAIPGTTTTTYFCIGQYHCECEDINVLCSCEDEEAGCNPGDASEDPEECPEGDAKADNIGGCSPGQQYCNEYGELVMDNGRMVIITNSKGYQIPSGGCGGITGGGSTDYYKQYVSASATLVE